MYSMKLAALVALLVAAPFRQPCVAGFLLIAQGVCAKAAAASANRIR